MKQVDPKFPADLSELEIRPGLTIVRSETLGKYFVRETMERVEDLPAPVRREIEDLLKDKKS